MVHSDRGSSFNFRITELLRTTARKASSFSITNFRDAEILALKGIVQNVLSLFYFMKYDRCNVAKLIDKMKPEDKESHE